MDPEEEAANQAQAPITPCAPAHEAAAGGPTKRSIDHVEEAMNDEPPVKKVAVEPVENATSPKASAFTTEEEELMMMEDGGAASAVAASSSTTAPSKDRGRQKQKKGRKYLGKDTSRNYEDQRNLNQRNSGNVDGIEKEKKLPKKKCAVLLGFSGQGYSGMQM
jgi:hypothetical protein